MKNEGWTLGDLAGELLERGIRIEDLSPDEIYKILDCPTPEKAAKEIENDL